MRIKLTIEADLDPELWGPYEGMSDEEIIELLEENFNEFVFEELNNKWTWEVKR